MSDTDEQLRSLPDGFPVEFNSAIFSNHPVRAISLDGDACSLRKHRHDARDFTILGSGGHHGDGTPPIG